MKYYNYEYMCKIFRSRIYVANFVVGIKSSIVITSCEGEGQINDKLEVKDGEDVLSVDCMISVSSKQASG